MLSNRQAFAEGVAPNVFPVAAAFVMVPVPAASLLPATRAESVNAMSALWGGLGTIFNSAEEFEC